MSRNTQLEELVLEMLERFGVLSDGTPLADDATPLDAADCLAGIEAYSVDLGAQTYVVLPEDVQELFLLMASVIYADSQYEDEEDEDDEFSGGPVFEFELDPRPVRDSKAEAGLGFDRPVRDSDASSKAALRIIKDDEENN